jgi:hypothetical protein
VLQAACAGKPCPGNAWLASATRKIAMARANPPRRFRKSRQIHKRLIQKTSSHISTEKTYKYSVQN